ncbi:MAG: hypothetical protein RDU01_03355 [Thermodesulfovibrionales bacterium]|nr:hypothetical protein [Thermodesulfovibrionales bacterium]
MTGCGDRRLFKPPAMFPVLFALCFLLIACGRKGDPTLISYEKPEAPSNLHAVQRESEFMLSWDFPGEDTTLIKGFHVLRSTGGDFKEIAFLANKKRSFTDTDIKGISSRTYKIIAENLRGVMSKDSVTLKIADANLPAPPAALSFTIQYDVLVLSWKSAGEGITYNIYRHSAGTESQNPVNPEPLKETSFRDVFDMKKAVLYTVKSLRESGIIYEGPASREIRIDPAKLVPSPPSNLQAVPSGENVYLLWKESPNTWIKSYRIYRETDRKKGFVLIGETQIPSFIDKEKPSKKRHYRVTAVGPLLESAPAEVKNIVSSK